MNPVDRTPRVVYQQGDHVCTLYSSSEEQISAAVQCIRDALARRERCLYVCGDCEPDAFRIALRTAGIDVDAQAQRGAIVLLTKADGHLKSGSFNPARMIERLNTEVQDALASGFTGLCAAGDMTWLLDEAPGSDKVAEYESLLNHFYSNNRAVGLCQYNRKTLPATTLDHCLATHPWVRMEGPILLANPFYEVQERGVRRVPNPDDLERKLALLEAARRRSGVTS